MLTDTQLNEFRRDGYAVIKGFLTPDEAESIREDTVREIEACEADGRALVETGPKGQRRMFPGDMLMHDAGRRVLLESRLVDLMRNLLGGDPVYWGEGSFWVGSVDEYGSGRAWHRDSYCDQADPDVPYPLVRCGLYFQETGHHSGGLGVIARSQAGARPQGGKIDAVRHLARQWLGAPRTVLVSTDPGDLVIWDMRLIHTGEVVRVKHAPKLRLPIKAQGWVPLAARIPEERERVVMFPSFGRPGPDLDAYLADKNASREYFKDVVTRVASYPSELVSRAEAAGLHVVSPAVADQTAA